MVYLNGNVGWTCDILKAIVTFWRIHFSYTECEINRGSKFECRFRYAVLSLKSVCRLYKMESIRNIRCERIDINMKPSILIHRRDNVFLLMKWMTLVYILLINIISLHSSPLSMQFNKVFIFCAYSLLRHYRFYKEHFHSVIY